MPVRFRRAGLVVAPGGTAHVLGDEGMLGRGGRMDERRPCRCM